RRFGNAIVSRVRHDFTVGARQSVLITLSQQQTVVCRSRYAIIAERQDQLSAFVNRSPCSVSCYNSQSVNKGFDLIVNGLNSNLVLAVDEAPFSLDANGSHSFAERPHAFIPVGDAQPPFAVNESVLPILADGAISF